jgi:hypothetical protein
MCGGLQKRGVGKLQVTPSPRHARRSVSCNLRHTALAQRISKHENCPIVIVPTDFAQELISSLPGGRNNPRKGRVPRRPFCRRQTASGSGPSPPAHSTAWSNPFRSAEVQVPVPFRAPLFPHTTQAPGSSWSCRSLSASSQPSGPAPRFARSLPGRPSFI